MKALVLDGDQLSTLAIVRSLGRNGWQVTVGANTPGSVAARSRHCRNNWVYPDPMLERDRFLKELAQYVAQGGFDVVVPVTERSLVPLRAIRAQLENTTRVAMASEDALEVVLSKSRTMKLAARLGVPVPASVTVEGSADLDAAARIGFPLVLKSDTSKVWDANGTGTSFSAGYATDRAELGQRWDEQERAGRCIAQQRVEGIGVGIGVLAREGELLCAFQYRRLHEVPIAGGGSSYRVSEPLDPQLVGDVQRILAQLRWDGVAMFEFKRSEATGQYWLLEINGRFWGSLPLAVAAGVDFPAALVELVVEGKVPGPARYRSGVRCRNLTGEYAWLKEAMRRRPKPFTRYPSMLSVLRDSVRMLNPFERWDAQQISDPVPGIAEALRLVAETARGLKARFDRGRALRSARKLRKTAHAYAMRLATARNVLVLCHGNIMRSPYAGEKLRTMLGRRRNEVEIITAGLAAQRGRPADSRVLDAAHARGIDLGTHRAQPVTAAMVEAADVVLVMDAGQLVEVASRFPGAGAKTFLLANLAADSGLEIPDPVSRDRAFLEQCLNQVDIAMRPVATILKQRAPASAA